MIIVDTNVVSEALRPGRSLAVVGWLDRQMVESLYFTAIGLSELRLGIECLPSGKRKAALSEDVAELVESVFSSRVLSFDKDAAIAYGAMVAAARSGGRAVSVTDGQIAAIARVRGFAVATRDVSPFKALGTAVINPWEEN